MTFRAWLGAAVTGASMGLAACAGEGSVLPPVAGNVIPGAQAGPAPGPQDTEHATLGQGECARCHTEQNRWWFDDWHQQTAVPLITGDSRYLEIARRYGLRYSDLVLGTSVCARCHATVVTAESSNPVRSGVSCESCHGPAADWLEAHEEGDPKLGAERAGYQRAIRLGMVHLRDNENMARVCTECHYITDEALLRAGHPFENRAFDWARAFDSVRHWPPDRREPPAFVRAVEEAIDRRGRARLVPLPALVPSGPVRLADRALRQLPRAPLTEPILVVDAEPMVDCLEQVPPFDPGQAGSPHETIRLLLDRLESVERACAVSPDGNA